VHKKLFLADFLVSILVVSGFILVNTLPFGTVQASTTVTGIITSDTTWTKANSPYSLTGPVAVNSGVTLTVEAGVLVNLNSYYIKVNGTLVARGNNANQIYFNNGAIRFTSVSNSWSEQTGSGCIIENAILNLTSIDIINASPKIHGNILTSAGINFEQSAAPIISNNTITGVGGNGISIHSMGNSYVSDNIISNCYWGIGAYSSGTITDNTVSGCQVGIAIYGDTPTVQRNLITGNTKGIEIFGHSMVAGVATIQNNTITSNSVGIFIVGVFSTSILYNNIYSNIDKNFNLTVSSILNATYNWWGTADTQAISQTITAPVIDFTGSAVTYIPFLNSSNPEASPIHGLNPTSPTPTPTESASPTPTPIVTQSPNPVPTLTQTSTPSPTPQPQPFLTTWILIGVVVLAIVLGAGLLVYFKKRKH
jgi:parallel beta-helix repeat protein